MDFPKDDPGPQKDLPLSPEQETTVMKIRDNIISMHQGDTRLSLAGSAVANRAGIFNFDPKEAAGCIPGLASFNPGLDVSCTVPSPSFIDEGSSAPARMTYISSEVDVIKTQEGSSLQEKDLVFRDNRTGKKVTVTVKADDLTQLNMSAEFIKQTLQRSR